MATHMDEYLRATEDAAAAINAHTKAEATRQKAATTKLAAKLDELVQEVATLKDNGSKLEDKVGSLEAELTVVKEEHNIELASVKKDFVLANKKNELLELIAKEKDEEIGELGRRVEPNGRWIWAARMVPDSVGGSWKWQPSSAPPSPSKKKKPKKVAAARAPVVLMSFPDELLLMIASLLTKNDKLKLVLASFKWFDILADELYSKAYVNEDKLDRFLGAKLTCALNLSARVIRLRKTKLLSLRRKHKQSPSLAGHAACTLLPIPQELLLDVVELNMWIVTGLKFDLDYWYSVLSICDPKIVFLDRVKTNDVVTLPAVSPVSPFACDFAQRWDELREAYFYGADSVPVVEGTSNELALRAGENSRPTTYAVVKTAVGGGAQSSDVTSVGLEPVLAKFTSMVPQPEDAWIGVRVSWVKENTQR